MKSPRCETSSKLIKFIVHEFIVVQLKNRFRHFDISVDTKYIIHNKPNMNHIFKKQTKVKKWIKFNITTSIR